MRRYGYLIMVWLLLGTAAVLFTGGDAGRDVTPVIEGGRLWRAGIDPFSAAGQAVIYARYQAPGYTQCEGCIAAYPATAMIVGLPFSLLPPPFGEYGLMFAGLAAVVVALHLHRVHPVFALLYAPPASAAIANNPILLATGLLMIGALLAEQRRWWLLALCIVIPIALKPHSVILIAAWLGWLALWRGRWAGVLPILVTGFGLLGVSLLMFPGWIPAWLAQANYYREVAWLERGGMAFFWFMLPWAALLFVLRQHLGGVVLAQACIPGMAIPYTYTPLMVGVMPYSGKWYVAIVSRLAAIGGYSDLVLGRKDALSVLLFLIIPYTILCFSPLLSRFWERLRESREPVYRPRTSDR